MPPKGGNAKKESGRAKKAENESKKKDAAEAERERKEADNWTDKDVKGGKARLAEKEEKRKADIARKAEAARLLAEEEASLKAKPKPSPSAKKGKEKEKPAGPGAIAAGKGPVDYAGEPTEEIESFAATGIDNALDLLEVVTAKVDKASIGTQAAGIEKHPERRFKAAFEAYQDREMENIKQEHPGLRLQQYKDLLFKQFQKSPDNPYNQTTVAYDAKKDDKVSALKARKAEIEDRLRE